MIMQIPFHFLRNCKCIITDISYCNDPVLDHLIFCSLNCCQDLFFLKMSFGNYFKNKINKAGLLWNKAF